MSTTSSAAPAASPRLLFSSVRSLSPSIPAISPSGSAMRLVAATKVAPTKAIRRMIEGSAIRRRRVKISARNQAVPATIALGRSTPRLPWSSVSAFPGTLIAPPIDPTAISRMITPMVTKMSLKLVTRRKLSSSPRGISRWALTCARKAPAASVLRAPAATAELMSSSEYTVPSSVFCRGIELVSYSVNTPSLARSTAPHRHPEPSAWR